MKYENYILTITAKRKGGKRHIVERSQDILHLRILGEKNLDSKRYEIEIYNGKWELLYQMGDDNKLHPIKFIK